MAIESRDGAFGERLSLLKLDLYLKGELEPEEMERVRKGLVDDPDAVRYLREAGEKTLGRTWPEMAPGSRSPMRTPTMAARFRSLPFAAFLPRRSPGWVIAIALILAVGAAFWVYNPGTGTDPSPVAFNTVAKGGSGRLEVRMDLGGRLLESGETGTLKEGETARIQYRTMESPYVRILIQMDGRKAEEARPIPGALGPATRWKEIRVTLPPAKEWRHLMIWVISASEEEHGSEISRLIETAPNEGTDHVARFQIESAVP